LKAAALITATLLQIAVLENNAPQHVQSHNSNGSPGSGSCVLVLRLSFPDRFLTPDFLTFFARLVLRDDERFLAFEAGFAIWNHPPAMERV
jgi:hypothetical protein